MTVMAERTPQAQLSAEDFEQLARLTDKQLEGVRLAFIWIARSTTPTLTHGTARKGPRPMRRPAFRCTCSAASAASADERTSADER